ncbi:MAG: hypothetical protein HY301_13305 [Verrucomicrobia bacterium]|nr:hypothetical protein [Verrucomicrobiota bacterium]
MLVVRCFFVVALAFSSSAAETFTPGRTYFGRSNYIEYLAGDLPFVLSAPHGGREKPAELPDREKGTFAFDTNTQELARAIRDEFIARSGHYPHIIISRVQRRKLDCNREIVEAAAGHKLAEQSWNEYHAFIDAAQKSVVAKYGKGFFIDLHGHGHKDARLELGLGHNADVYAKPDAELNKPDIYEQSTLRLIARTGKISYTALLRGPTSFGALMEKQGFPATPSPGKPVPGTPYFNGGYTARRHSAVENFAGLQIESNSKGVRDTEANRKKFATALFNTLKTYLDAHLGLKLSDNGAGRSSQ